jgi:catechol 2,3-dioxygenase-like lactoylglutathione lyase family enzyme
MARTHKQMKTGSPTPLGRQVLDFVMGEIAAGRPFPKYPAINAHIGWRDTNHNSARHTLQYLAAEGYLTRKWVRGKMVFEVPQSE